MARALFPSDRSASLQSKDPTPRLANGKPDLSGNWGGGGRNWRYGNRRCGPTQLEGCSPQWNQTMDLEPRTSNSEPRTPNPELRTPNPEREP